MYKYIILDFGKVIAGPTTGDWFMTPKFLELIDINKLNVDKYDSARKKYDKLLGEKLITQEEEYDMFTRFYDGVLSESEYPNYSKEIAKEIAYDMSYCYDKYTLYSDIFSELDRLKEKYTLILLTDNWPCATNYLKENNLHDYFDKVYISSIYGAQKRDGSFFEYPIKDYDIKPGEALFIDDSELNLDNAKLKGMDVLRMDRENEVTNSKHKIIHDLYIV